MNQPTLSHFIALGEGFTTEFKRSMPSDLGREICAVFRGSTKAHILDRKAFHGNLYAIYQEVMTYFQAKLNSALIPHAQGRDERLELPESALREAVVNAIAHRDYRSTANVQVYIF